MLEVSGDLKLAGIIAGEANVEINYAYCKFMVFSSAKDPAERKIFQDCLKVLGVGSIPYGDFKAIVI